MFTGTGEEHNRWSAMWGGLPGQQNTLARADHNEIQKLKKQLDELMKDREKLEEKIKLGEQREIQKLKKQLDELIKDREKLQERIKLSEQLETQLKESIQKEEEIKRQQALKEKNIIRRSIEFPPKYKQAGIAILSYFSRVVEQKYPDIPVKISIEQEDKIITMIIETPEGEREKIESTLDDYGKVIQGQIPPEKFLDDKLAIIELKHKLELTLVELRTTKELYNVIENQNKTQIQFLESEVKWLRRHIGKNISIPPLIDRTISTSTLIDVNESSWDVFISHANEDKEKFVRSLADALMKEGLKIWFDEFTLKVGDSLRESIDHGLANSRYGIVIISPNFLKKAWPQKELDALASSEVSGRKVILPVWHNIDLSEIRKHSPILADRIGVSSKDGIKKVVASLLNAMKS